MGQVAEILSSPDWANKSALEKAAARKDLFSLTLEENPDFKATVVAADEPTRQQLKDDWQAKLSASFPTAFKTKGYTFVKEEGTNAYKYPKEREADVPVADYKTEQVLASITPDSTQGRKLLKEYYDGIKDDPEKVKPFRILMRSRYGNINDILKTDEIDDENITKENAPSALEKGLEIAKQASPMAVRAGGAIVGGMMGGTASSPSAGVSGPVGPAIGFSAGSAAGAAAVEPFAQWLEQRLGQRDRYNVGEGLLNVGLASINPVKVSPGAGALMKLGTRATEGALVSGAQNIGQQTLFSDKPFSLAELNTAIGTGVVVGGGIEGLGQLSSKIKAKLIGKNPTELRRSVSEMLADVKLPEADKEALTAIQKKITELSPGTSKAVDSASAIIAAENTVPGKTAADSAEVFAKSDVGLKPIPPDASVKPLGKRYLVMEGIGEPVEQYQVNLPGEERGRTLTAQQLAAEGYAPPASPDAAATPDAVRQKYADVFSSSPEGQVPVEIRRPDGTTYPAVVNGYYDLPSGAAASVGRKTDSGWSHGMLREGEEIVSAVPSAEQWPVYQTEEKAKRIFAGSDGFIDPVLQRSLAAGASGAGGLVYGFGQDPEAPVDERIKKGLTYGILGAGGGYSAGRAFTRFAANATPKTNSSALNKWYTRMKAPDKPALVERLKNIPNAARTELSTAMATLDKLPAQIAKANSLPINTPHMPLSRQFELVNGANGKALIDAEDYSRGVLEKIGEGEWKDFNVLLATKRTGQRLQADAALAAEKARINAIPEAQRTPEEVAALAEADNRRRVADETLESVDNALAGLRAKLGDKRFSELDQLAAGEFQQQADKALRVLVDSGRMSEAQYGQLKTSNDFYAPFRVLEYAEDFDGATPRLNPVDTAKKYTQAITGIDSLDFHLDDPAKVLAEKIYSARVLAEKNIKMNVLANLADEDASGTVIKKLFNGETAPRGMEAVNYFDKGVPRQLAVAPDVAQAIKGLNAPATGLVSRFVNAVNKPFRFGATAGNVAFQTVNAPADAYRQATMSKYGIGAGKPVMDTLRYPADFIHALYSSVLSRPSTSGAAGAVAGFYGGYETGDTTEEKWRNAAAGAVVGSVAGRAGQRGIRAGVGALRNAGAGQVADAIDPTTLYRDFYQSGAAGSTIQDMIESVASGRKAPSARDVAGHGVIRSLQDFGRAVEETTKMMGFKRGIRIEGIDKLPKQKAYEKLQEVASEIRNFSGSPDFAVAGNSIKDLNAAIVFLNPRIQGMVEDGARLFGRDGMQAAGKAWTLLGATAGVAAVHLWGRNNAPENKADYEQVSPDEKYRNAMIPRYDDKGQPLYFTNERGEKVRDYWRIPLRDTGQSFYQMVNAAMDFAESKDPERVKEFAGNLAENLSPVNVQGDTIRERAESAISSLGPVGSVPYMLATGRNPGLHRDIMSEQETKASPENQFRADTPEVYKTAASIMPQWIADPLRSPMMLQNLTGAATGGIISQFTPPKAATDRDATATAMQQSPLARRFVRSTYVQGEEAPEAAKEILTQQADNKVADRRDGQAIYDKIMGVSPEQRMEEFSKLAPEDKGLARAEAKRRKAQADSEHLQAIKEMGVENGARAKYLSEYLPTLSQEERVKIVNKLKESKLVSKDVIKQMRELQSAGRN